MSGTVASSPGPAAVLPSPLPLRVGRRFGRRRSAGLRPPAAAGGNGKGDWDAAWRDLRKNLPSVEPASGARPAARAPLDSRAARQAAARAGTPPAPRLVKGGGGGGARPPPPPSSTGDPAVDAVRAQERVALDVWSDARFAAAGGALAAGLLVAFLAQGPP